MSETRSTAATRAQPTRTHWTGLVFFAGVMMILLGFFQAIAGLAAIFNDDFYRVSPNGLVIHADYTVWCWVHLILGLIAVGTGIGFLLGQTWARVTGIIIAVLSALANIAFLPAYPIWATIIIALDVLAIYALAVHGREVQY